jgi:hypothetical protein
MDATGTLPMPVGLPLPPAIGCAEPTLTEST